MAGKRPRVLVTRPEPGATRTAARLREAGLEPVVLPFTEIVPQPVADAMVADAQNCDAVAVTSANALVHAPPALLDALHGKTVFAVGDATARAADDLGLTDVQSADGAAGQLAALIAGSTSQNTRVAYLCGRLRTGELEAELARLARAFVLIETYDTQKVSHLTDKFNTLWRAERPDAIMFHSGVSAAIFGTELMPTLLPQHIETTRFFAVSRRAAEKLPEELVARVVVADAPRDDALVAAARAHLLGNPSHGAA